jgi:SAM-dependent methyltransferase
LRDRLGRNPKNRFIIDSAEGGADPENILEMGCGRGYLTSYFIARGLHILGVDVAPSAVNWAKEAFGDHFVLDDDPRVGEGAPYDLIYHVGTIGCVEAPLEFTHNLLSLTRPGGRVLFNAPNVQSCRGRGMAWIDGSFPPDLVTLFDPGIWPRYFAGMADVEVVVESSSDREWSGILAGGLMKRLAPGRLPKKNLFREVGAGGVPEHPGTGTVDRLLLRSALLMTRLSRLVAPGIRPPAKFGIHVNMTKKKD